MQTLRQIQQLLNSANLSPNRQFGQNFLIDLNLMRLLLEKASITKKDVVLEVGCGTGSLTEGLAERAAKVVTVEIDKNLAMIAKEQLAEEKNVCVLNTDILERKHSLDTTVIDKLESEIKKTNGRLLLVANLPYNIACPLMFNLITGHLTADQMYITVQKEVADRMTAEPGTKHYGTLTIMLSATGRAKTIRILKPSVFWPQPKVDSAMISFVRSEEKVAWIGDMRILSELVNLLMQHRRKMIKACTKFSEGKLSAIANWPEIFEKASIDPEKRPDQISPEDYVKIANLCCKLLK